MILCFPCFSDPVPSSKHVLVVSVVNRVLAHKSVEHMCLQCSKLLLLDVDVGSGNWKTHPQISFEVAGTLTFTEGVTTTAATRWCDLVCALSMVIQPGLSLTLSKRGQVRPCLCDPLPFVHYLLCACVVSTIF